MKQITLFILIMLTFGKLVLSDQLKTIISLKTDTTDKRINLPPMNTIDLPKNAQVY